MKTRLFLIAALLALAGCTDAERAGFNAYGQKHRITLYSAGKVVGQWESTGAVLNEEHGDGRYFEDSKTGTLVSFSGTYVIEVIK